MVMFRDDDARMKAAERAAEPRWKRNVRRVFKTAFWCALLVGLGLTVLSMQAGRSDSLKKGLEQYLGQATGMQAEIGMLKYMTFFPVVSVTFDQFSLYESIPGSGPTQPLRGLRAVTAGHVSVAMNFWDLFLSRRRLRALDIREMEIEPGIIDKRGLSIASLRLDKAAYDNRAGILLQGMYGGEAVKAAIEMKQKGRSLVLPDHAGFTVDAGPLAVRGTIAHRFGQGLVLDVARLGVNEKGFAGKMIFGEQKKGLTFSADVHFGRSAMDVDIRRDQKTPWQGTVVLPVLDAADLSAMLGIILEWVSRIPRVEQHALDARLTVKKIENGGVQAAPFTAKISMKDSTLSLSAFEGGFPASLLDATLPPASVHCFAARQIPGTVKLDTVVLATDAGSFAGSGLVNGQALHFALRPRAGKTDCSLP